MDVTREEWDALLGILDKLEHELALGFKAMKVRLDQLDAHVAHLHGMLNGLDD